MIREISTPDPQHLAESLRLRVLAILQQAIAARGSASLVVSGGRTPRRLFDLLAQSPLDWSKVSVTLADERLVARGHADHNAGLVRAHLLQGKAAAAQFHPLWDGQGDPRAVAAAALAHFPAKFDVLLLGMGEDGHTASLFPDAPGLADALDPAHADPLLILPETASRQPRVSLSLSRLLASAHILLAFEGEAKHAVFTRAMAEGPQAELPVRAVLRHAAVPVEVYWSQTTG